MSAHVILQVLKQLLADTSATWLLSMPICGFAACLHSLQLSGSHRRQPQQPLNLHCFSSLADLPQIRHRHCVFTRHWFAVCQPIPQPPRPGKASVLPTDREGISLTHRQAWHQSFTHAVCCQCGAKLCRGCSSLCMLYRTAAWCTAC